MDLSKLTGISPGTWIKHPLRIGKPVPIAVFNCPGKNNLTIADNPRYMGVLQNERDADLLLAAPALLETVIELYNILESLGDETWSHEMVDAKALISKFINPRLL